MDLSKYSSKTLIYNGIKHNIPIWLYDKYLSMGINFNEEYVSYLLKYNPTDAKRSIAILANMDIKNKKYIGTYGEYGKIVKVNKYGDVIGTFENVLEAFLDSPDQTANYSFELLHKKRVTNQKESCIFFGKKIMISDDTQDTAVIKALNTTIRKCKNIYADKNDTWKKRYKEISDPNLTYTEFLMQWIYATSFECGDWISYSLSSLQETKYTLHNIEKCNDYTERINNLFNRYSINGKTAFERIYELNKTENFYGIYLLCLPQIKGCYLGKTTKSFATRIPQHFTKPNSSFDVKYKPEDIKEIYILPLDETVHFIDLIEEDCIATLGQNICLNAIAGGTSIELIKSETYNPKSHLIKQNLLEWVINDSIRFVNYVREHNFDK